jgi:two-component system sensor histidine kinase MprB
VCAAAVALVVVLGSFVAYGLVRDSLHREVDASLREAAAAPFDGPAPPDVAFEAPVELQFVPPRGPVILPMRGSAPLLPRTDEVIAVAAGRKGAFFENRTIDGVRARIYVAPGAGGFGAVQAVRPLDEVDDVLATLRLGLGVLAAIGIVLAGLLGRLAARAAVQPVTELTATAEHVAATQDLSRRIVAHGRDELGRLAGAFNTMLEKLDDSRRAQRRLVSDASHELRTPLTSLRTNLEVLADDSALETADRERLRADLVAQLEELTDLVGDLVDLAREDEPVGAEVEDVRLDLLAASAVERARRHAPGVRFELRAEPTVVRAVPARLDRAVANLLDNAAKFGGGDGPVEVRVGDGEIAVRDHGPGIAEEDRPRVFDRFYRAAAARGRPGSGLGLAIVRQVAESHGGRVSAEAPAGGGALLRLSLTS